MTRRERDRSGGRRDKKREVATAHLDLVPAGSLTTPQARSFAECPCPKDCTLHGECVICVAYHARKHALPRCERL
jgi:hypothetical protein